MCGPTSTSSGVSLNVMTMWFDEFAEICIVASYFPLRVSLGERIGMLKNCEKTSSSLLASEEIVCEAVITTEFTLLRLRTFSAKSRRNIMFFT